MPGRLFSPDEYRFGYQGQFAEHDEETGYDAFEARLWDSRIGRWMSPDPAGQFWRPYLGMGNSPVNGVDPDGRLFGPGNSKFWKRMSPWHHYSGLGGRMPNFALHNSTLLNWLTEIELNLPKITSSIYMGIDKIFTGLATIPIGSWEDDAVTLIEQFALFNSRSMITNYGLRRVRSKSNNLIQKIYTGVFLFSGEGIYSVKTNETHRIATFFEEDVQAVENFNIQNNNYSITKIRPGLTGQGIFRGTVTHHLSVKRFMKYGERYNVTKFYKPTNRRPNIHKWLYNINLDDH